MKLLLSAYACEPGRGSESAVGWGIAQALARHHDVWVITRANNQEAIERAAGDSQQVPSFIYYDLPRWLRFWKRGPRGARLYYYLWQIGVYRVASKWHRSVGFDLTQHVTFAQYWTPTALRRLEPPLVWGPVGGGESVPRGLWRSLGARGFLTELARVTARRLGEKAPSVRATARRASLGLGATPETAERLRRIGAARVEVMSQVALTDEEIVALGEPMPSDDDQKELTALVVGRLVPLKGVHLVIQAASLMSGGLRFLVVGDGPDGDRLKALAHALEVADRFKFVGSLERSQVMELYRRCDALVQASLHESGGWVVAEGMAAGLPIVGLATGGTKLLLESERGILVEPAASQDETVGRLADALASLTNPALRASLGEAAQAYARMHLTFRRRAEDLNEYYREVARLRIFPGEGGIKSLE